MSSSRRTGSGSCSTAIRVISWSRTLASSSFSRSASSSCPQLSSLPLSCYSRRARAFSLADRSAAISFRANSRSLFSVCRWHSFKRSSRMVSTVWMPASQTLRRSKRRPFKCSISLASRSSSYSSRFSLTSFWGEKCNRYVGWSCAFPILLSLGSCLSDPEDSASQLSNIRVRLLFRADSINQMKVS
jgi:hypothetical protein